jgi:hypothetical protein
MKRQPLSSPDAMVSHGTGEDASTSKEHQWWVRVMFACVSLASAVLTFDVLRTVMRYPDVAGVLLLSLLALVTTGFAVWAAPNRFHKRYMRRLLVATLVVDLITNVLIILK